MAKKSKQAYPTAPDPDKTAAAQAAANRDAVRESARVNTPDLTGPFGTTRYVRDEFGVPTEQITAFSPQGQRIFDSQQNITEDLTNIARNRIQGLPEGEFSTEGINYNPNEYANPILSAYERSNHPFDPQNYDDINRYRDDVQDAFYNRSASLLEPKFQQQEEALEQRLADQGIAVGSEAYNDVMGNFQRERDRAYSNLSNDAVLAAGGEAQRQLGMEQNINNAAFTQDLTAHQQGISDIGTQTQIEQDLRNRAIQELLLGRNQAINEVSAITQGAPALGVPQSPGVPQYNVAAPDISGLTMAKYNADINAYNQAREDDNSFMKNMINLGGLGVKGFTAFSHSGYKDILSDDEYDYTCMAKGMPVKLWKYKNAISSSNNNVIGMDPHLHIGPMAEDWHRETGLGDGHTINLIDAFGFALGCIQQLQKRVDELEQKHGK